LSVLVISECWWARFVPQLWLLPGIIAALAQGSSRRELRLGAGILLLAMMLNLCLVGGAYTWGNIVRTMDAHAQLRALKASEKTVTVYYDWFRSLRVRFDEFGIDAREVSAVGDLPCANPEYMVGTLARFCVNP
jgi:hypothetical protein